MFLNTQKLLEESLLEFAQRTQINQRKNRLDIITSDLDSRIENLKRLQSLDIENVSAFFPLLCPLVSHLSPFYFFLNFRIQKS